MNRKRVVVAMSGGVDSSVAAMLLKEKGYEVIGVTMNLFSLPKEACRDRNLRSCCGWRAVEDAHQVAIILGIEHFVVDFRQEFESHVIQNFCKEYLGGRTPNPCIRCNQFIKFQVLLEKAKEIGADFIATGHHARIERDRASGRYVLKKGKDREKDQSYFLYTLNKDELSQTLMPIGYLTKREVRKFARKYQLPVAEKPESQEICFVPDKDYARFLRERFPAAEKPGPILDTNGCVIGEHPGIIHFTVGQRRGIRIASPRPLYVLSIDHEKNAIVVGTYEKLYKKILLASEVNIISGDKVELPLQVSVKIRYKHTEAQALLKLVDSQRACVEFEKPQRAITPGQAAVFYVGDVVLGGGIIERAIR